MTAIDGREPGQSRTLVTICTYNERENIPLLLPEILSVLPDSQILIVDDNSPDGTGALADDFAKQDSRIHVLHRAGKQGLGTAILAGFQFAIDQGYEFVLNMDADFSHHPRHLPALVELSRECDVAIGSRYIPGGRTVGWSMTRRMMSQAVNLYARWLLWLRVQDTSGAFRCYRVSKLREIEFSRIRAKGYAFQEEILYRCRRIDCVMKEAPIVFEDRRLGQSKINLNEALAAIWVILRLAIDGILGVPVRKL